MDNQLLNQNPIAQEPILSPMEQVAMASGSAKRTSVLLLFWLFLAGFALIGGIVATAQKSQAPEKTFASEGCNTCFSSGSCKSESDWIAGYNAGCLNNDGSRNNVADVDNSGTVQEGDRGVSDRETASTSNTNAGGSTCSGPANNSHCKEVGDVLILGLSNGRPETCTCERSGDGNACGCVPNQKQAEGRSCGASSQCELDFCCSNRPAGGGTCVSSNGRSSGGCMGGNLNLTPTSSSKVYIENDSVEGDPVENTRGEGLREIKANRNKRNAIDTAAVVFEDIDQCLEGCRSNNCLDRYWGGVVCIEESTVTESDHTVCEDSCDQNICLAFGEPELYYCPRPEFICSPGITTCYRPTGGGRGTQRTCNSRGDGYISSQRACVRTVRPTTLDGWYPVVDVNNLGIDLEVGERAVTFGDLVNYTTGLNILSRLTDEERAVEFGMDGQLINTLDGDCDGEIGLTDIVSQVRLSTVIIDQPYIDCVEAKCGLSGTGRVCGSQTCIVRNCL